MLTDGRRIFRPASAPGAPQAPLGPRELVSPLRGCSCQGMRPEGGVRARQGLRNSGGGDAAAGRARRGGKAARTGTTPGESQPATAMAVPGWRPRMHRMLTLVISL